LAWFKSYLELRRQIVKIGGEVSDELTNDHGVPQGSILGPILFVLYINDLVKVVGPSVDIHLFADDTLLYASSENIDELVLSINGALLNIQTYTCQNLLKINPTKTKYMLLSTDRVGKMFDESGYHIQIGTTVIERVKKIKYLGIMVDDHLTFKEHANQIISRISFIIQYFYRCSQFLTMWSKIIVYNTLILPHFNYCSSVLFMLNQNELGRLQKLQNRAMRIILSCNKYTPIKFMLECLEWLPITVYIRFNVMTLIHKIRKGYAPSYLTKKVSYNNNVHDYETRQRNHINIARKNKKLGQNSVFYKGFDVYNRLPEYIKNCSCILTFKKHLKLHLLRENNVSS